MHFEVGKETNLKQDDSVLLNESLYGDRKGTATPVPVGIAKSPLLPSLSNPNHNGSYNGNQDLGEQEKGKSMNIFNIQGYNKEENASSSSLASEGATEKEGVQLVQPRSRYTGTPFPSLVVESIKRNESDPAGVKQYTRSSPNLVANAHTPVSKMMNRTAASSNVSLTLNNQMSQGSKNPTKSSVDKVLGLSSDSGTDLYGLGSNRVFQDSSEDLSQPELTPFGGFANPLLENGFLNRENIFESADWRVIPSVKGNSSLIKALKAAEVGGVVDNVKWVGMIPMPTDAVPEATLNKIKESLSKNYDSELVICDDFTFQCYYTSFCKQILWPTLHYQIPDDPKSKAFEDHSWSFYQLANQLTADKIVETYKKVNSSSNPSDPDNMIWIHDYHLLLVPRMVKEKVPEAKIGLFLHVSFPSSEVFRCFAQRTALLKGMLSANCITFQTDEYVKHFLQTCNRLLLADINQFGITFEGKFTMINSLSVGIDLKELSQFINRDEVTRLRSLVRERWPNKQLIVSRDKLDRLRGIKQKLLAYEKFLHTNPEFVESTVLIQICPGSQKDPFYESEIATIEGRINSLTRDISFSQLVVILYQDISFEQYIALMSEASTFVVASMREGLNLTSNEFIVATSEKKSPLILSEFTGSSSVLNCDGEGALLINPWDTKRFAEAFKTALTMSTEEKSKRWKNCLNPVMKKESKVWVYNCVESIKKSWSQEHVRSLAFTTPLSRNIYEKFYASNRGGKRLFFLNLETSTVVTTFTESDSVLLEITSAKPAEAVLRSAAFTEPTRFMALLNDLISDPLNYVYITSFMKRSDLQSRYLKTNKVGLIAENGGYIKLVGSDNWITMVDENESHSWMPQVQHLVDVKVERLAGSHRMTEECSIRFDPGDSLLADPQRSYSAMGDLIQHINDLFSANGVHASLINGVVVVQNNQLPLKALKFVISYYKSKSEGAELASVLKEYDAYKMSETPSTTPLTECLNPLSPQLAEDVCPLSTIFFSGGTTPIDEPCFEYVNQIKGNNSLPEVLTVAVMGPDSSSTSATYGLSGKNELLSVLSKSA